MEKLGGATGDSEGVSFLATHPSSAERVAALRKAADEERPVYEALAGQGRHKLAEQMEQQRQARATAEAKERLQAAERVELEAKTAATLAARAESLRTEEAALTKSSRPPSGATTAVADEKCQDQTATRQTGMGTLTNGATYVKRCQKMNGEWQCQTL